MSETIVAPEILLSDHEAEVALTETTAVLEAAGSESYRAQLAELVAGIEARTLDEGDALALEPILELALQTGRIRAIYGPPGEQAALRLFRKLPRGKELQQSATQVSTALGSLRGQLLEGATLTAHGPGAYSLSLATNEGRLTVRLDRQGARITSVEV